MRMTSTSNYSVFGFANLCDNQRLALDVSNVLRTFRRSRRCVSKRAVWQLNCQKCVRKQKFGFSILLAKIPFKCIKLIVWNCLINWKRTLCHYTLNLWWVAYEYFEPQYIYVSSLLLTPQNILFQQSIFIYCWFVKFCSILFNLQNPQKKPLNELNFHVKDNGVALNIPALVRKIVWSYYKCLYFVHLRLPTLPHLLVLKVLAMKSYLRFHCTSHQLQKTFFLILANMNMIAIFLGQTLGRWITAAFKISPSSYRCITIEQRECLERVALRGRMVFNFCFASSFLLVLIKILTFYNISVEGSTKKLNGCWSWSIIGEFLKCYLCYKKKNKNKNKVCENI